MCKWKIFIYNNAKFESIDREFSTIMFCGGENVSHHCFQNLYVFCESQKDAKKLQLNLKLHFIVINQYYFYVYNTLLCQYFISFTSPFVFITSNNL